VTRLTRHFITGEVSDSGDPPDPATAARWRRRYAAGLRRLRQAGIRTVSDERAGAEIYVSLRARWDRHIRTLAPALDYRLEEIDPASADPESADRRPEFCARLPSVG
jgi:hypothetical protein